MKCLPIFINIIQKCEAESEAARTREAHDALIAELKDNVRDRIDAQKEAERLQVGLMMISPKFM